MTDIYLCDGCNQTMAGRAYKLRYYMDRDDKRVAGESRQDLCSKCLTTLFVKKDDNNIQVITFKEKEAKPRA